MIKNFMNYLLIFNTVDIINEINFIYITNNCKKSTGIQMCNYF